LYQWGVAAHYYNGWSLKAVETWESRTNWWRFVDARSSPKWKWSYLQSYVTCEVTFINFFTETIDHNYLTSNYTENHLLREMTTFDRHTWMAMADRLNAWWTKDTEKQVNILGVMTSELRRKGKISLKTVEEICKLE
jgi:hypothetical protein